MHRGMTIWLIECDNYCYHMFGSSIGHIRWALFFSPSAHSRCVPPSQMLLVWCVSGGTKALSVIFKRKSVVDNDRHLIAPLIERGSGWCSVLTLCARIHTDFARKIESPVACRLSSLAWYVIIFHSIAMYDSDQSFYESIVRFDKCSVAGSGERLSLESETSSLVATADERRAVSM